jgi:hypothetical protein
MLHKFNNMFLSAIKCYRDANKANWSPNPLIQKDSYACMKANMSAYLSGFGTLYSQESRLAAMAALSELLN